jgi:hypothetical protein
VHDVQRGVARVLTPETRQGARDAHRSGGDWSPLRISDPSGARLLLIACAAMTDPARPA